ncbi:Uncharacterized protein FKW44_021633 [Caligus rogercresseyi]|uniref:Uncharacterized protein n=1 Tax=Caligus rogercresseyi TaxID=217165 RepID=A0A7T8JVZ5_CALRO|nr:Uncharacterized protein FKW44_021633 [Caligus rogercresseyi]
MGVTAHTISLKLGRRNFAIACRRMEGSHTYDKVTEVLKFILQDWGIQWKTVGMVTDNAQDFVKAFNVYGKQTQLFI